MSYRSIKRVLGETNLERKCRILFGVCLALLIGGAFYWVDRVAEGLVNAAMEQYQEAIDQHQKNMRLKGRDLVDISLLQRHFERWKTKPEERKFVQILSSELQSQEYEHTLLALPDSHTLDLLKPRFPAAGSEETTILLSLKEEFERRKQDPSSTKRAAVDDKLGEEDAVFAPNFTVENEPDLVFAERSLEKEKAYHYFEPVVFSQSCRICHTSPTDVGAVSSAEGGGIHGAGSAFYVVKVVIPSTAPLAPYENRNASINWIRAILMTAGLVTFFVAMVALYVIVRYVIVKPLKHLRDVSDDVSRGKTEVRAELNTGDEFEELATSYNRMLRHLTDAHVEMRELNADLDAKVDELAQLNVRLYEMNRLKSDFLANMSHELRTPLNSIIGFSEVLRGIESLNDKQRRYAENIQKSGSVLLEMINDILDLAKLEAGKMDVRLSEFDIASLIGAHCDLVRSLTEDKNINLEVDVPRNLPPLFQDQVKVQQILTNLLSNAIKFTPEGGRITVSARRDERRRLVVTVSDTGVGIAEEDRDVIFEKFRQGPAVLGGNSLTREYSGTGLGLSIVKELCKLLGGEISFDSQVGMGSTFYVTLPWTLSHRPQRDQKLMSKLDELAKAPRAEFQPAHAASSQPHVDAATHEAVSPQTTSTVD